MKERETKPGDIVEASDGNRYLILPNRRKIYMGNKELNRIPFDDTIRESPEQVCEVLSSITVQY